MKRYYIVADVSPRAIMRGEWPEQDVNKIFELYDDNDIANAAVLHASPREPVVHSHTKQNCVELPNVKLLMTVQPKTPEKESEIQGSQVMMYDTTPVYRSTIQDCDILKCAYYIAPDLLHKEPRYYQEQKGAQGFSHDIQTGVMVSYNQLKQVADAMDRMPNARIQTFQLRNDAVYEAFASNGWMNRNTQNPHEMYAQHYLRDIRDHTPIDVAQEVLEMFNRFEQHFSCLPSKLPEGVRCTRAMQATMQEYLNSEFIHNRPESAQPLQRVLDAVRAGEIKAWEVAYDDLTEQLQGYQEYYETGTADIDCL